LAFAGRSNAGKSSAINTLCRQKRLAFASKTPGRTQHLNYFAIGAHAEDESLPAAFLVDLPGYGYAETDKVSKAHWGEELGAYLRTRDVLAGLVLIMDARRPMGRLDLALIEWFRVTGKPVHALLTKADKLNRSEAALTLAAVTDSLRAYSSEYSCALFSSLDRSGVESAERRVLEMLGLAHHEKRTPTQGE